MVRSTAAVLIALLLSTTANAQQAAPAPVDAPTVATPIHAAIEQIQFDQGAARQLAGPYRSSHNSSATKASAGFALESLARIALAAAPHEVIGHAGDARASGDDESEA